MNGIKNRERLLYESLLPEGRETLSVDDLPRALEKTGLRLDDPRLAGETVIVGGLGPRGVVATASYQARKSGVHSAMPMSRARRLCPQAHFLRPRMSRYREKSREVFAVFESFVYLISNGALEWGPLARRRQVDDAVSARRTVSRRRSEKPQCATAKRWSEL